MTTVSRPMNGWRMNSLSSGGFTFGWGSLIERRLNSLMEDIRLILIGRSSSYIGTLIGPNLNKYVGWVER